MEAVVRTVQLATSGMVASATSTVHWAPSRTQMSVSRVRRAVLLVIVALNALNVRKTSICMLVTADPTVLLAPLPTN